MNNAKALICSIITALIFSLAVSPFDQWYLAYIAFIPVLYLTYSSSYKVTLNVFLFVAIIIATAWWYSVIAYSWLTFLQIVAVMCASFVAWGILTRYIYKTIYSGFWSFLLPVLMWVGIERIHTSLYVGVPGNIGITQYNQPELIQLTSAFGIYAVSFIILLINSLLAHSFYLYRKRGKSLSVSVVPAIFAIFIFAINFTYGINRVSQDQHSGNIKVAIIQPVISSELYRNSWRSYEDRGYIKNILNELTSEAVNQNVDMLFWPEGGNGYINMRIVNDRNKLYEIARQHKVDLFISSDDIDSKGNKFNSVFSISNKGEYSGRYDKVNLIPGAEDSYTAGDGYKFVPSSYGNVGVAVCYESNFPEIFRESVELGAEILFASTSDSAFKRTSLAISHTNMSVFRALENNRWLVHASNTGPSMVVSPKGVITARTAMYERSVVYGNIEKIGKLSIYTRWGYVVPMILAVIVIVISIVAMIKELIAVWRRLKTKKASKINIKLKCLSLFNTVHKYYYVPVLYLAATIGLVVSSVVIVNASITDNESVKTIFQDFLLPVKLHKDTISGKFLQTKENTCGPAALSYLLNYYGLDISESDITKQIKLTRYGASMLELKTVASVYNFNGKGYKGNYEWLKQQALPLMAHINDKHYVVINKIVNDNVYMFDPLEGHVILKRSEFNRIWSGYVLTVRTKPIQSSI